jgi:dCTP deaminase
MSTLVGEDIAQRVLIVRDLVISPFYLRGISEGRTFGISVNGYDVRLDRDLWLWPWWGRLAATIEYIAMPLDLRAKLEDKSTNARIFVTVQNTNLEAGWYGYLTLELTRHLPWPVKLKKGTPIGQIIFEELTRPSQKGYTGKYQNQAAGPQKARFECYSDHSTVKGSVRSAVRQMLSVIRARLKTFALYASICLKSTPQKRIHARASNVAEIRRTATNLPMTPTTAGPVTVAEKNRPPTSSIT